MPVGKEAMTAETFSEDDYRDKLVGEGYSDESARMLAKKKKESFTAKKIEIDLGSLAKDDFKWKMSDEHLSPDERKKRQEQRDRRQKERAAHRATRRKQHEEVEEGIPEGKSEIDITLAKAKKRVWVKATAQKKGHYREMEVGRKETEFPPSRGAGSLFGDNESVDAKTFGPGMSKPIPSEKKERVDTSKIKKGMVIRHEDEDRRWRVVKVMPVNIQLVPVPTLPSDRPIMVKKKKLMYYVED